MNLGALIVVPLVAWHAYRAIRTIRTGAFESFGSVLNRSSDPDLFWLRVVRESCLAVLLATAFLWVLLGLSGTIPIWLFGGYAAVYVSLIVRTIVRRRRRHDHGA